MASGLVISFSGRIGSGKTSITQQLARLLAWPRVGFSDYLRTILASTGEHEPTRETLQNFGQSLVASDPVGFCRSVLSQVNFVGGGNLLLDGVRHVEIQRSIETIVRPSRAVLIYLSATDEIVEQRVQGRGTGEAELRRAEGHQVEQDLRLSLPQIANYIVDASATTHEVISECLTAIETSGATKSLISDARSTLSRSAL
jgi:dephospho-CoA kinase